MCGAEIAEEEDEKLLLRKKFEVLWSPSFIKKWKNETVTGPIDYLRGCALCHQQRRLHTVSKSAFV